MSVVAIFQVRSIEFVTSLTKEKTKRVSRRVKLIAVEGDLLGSSVPDGYIDMLAVNPSLAEEFELDGEFEVVFTKKKPGLPLIVT